MGTNISSGNTTIDGEVTLSELSVVPTVPISGTITTQQNSTSTAYTVPANKKWYVIFMGVANDAGALIRFGNNYEILDAGSGLSDSVAGYPILIMTAGQYLTVAYGTIQYIEVDA